MSEPMPVFGDPEIENAPSVWREVSRAHLHGYISTEAFNVLSAILLTYPHVFRSEDQDALDNEAFHVRAIADLVKAGVPEEPARDLIHGARDVATTYRTAIIGEWEQ